MNTSSIRLIFSLFAVTLLGMGLAGCGGQAPSAKGNILHMANGTEPADLDPQTVTGRPESTILRTLIQGLVRHDPKTLEPIPGQAESWDISEDGKTYTFYLRPEAKWSNGDPVTAHDFVGSFKRMLTPSLASEYAYQLHIVEGAEAYNKGETTDFSTVGFRVVDERTLVVQLRNPTSYFLNLLLHYSWHPVHLPTVEKFGGLEKKGTRWTRPENYVGNGPFILTEWKPNQHIDVRRSPTYWGAESVKIDGVRFYPIENTDTEERMFRAGQLDVTNGMPLNKVDEYRENRQDVLRVEPYLAAAFYKVNVSRPQLKDPRVRRALALAIDRVGLTKEVLRGAKFPARHFSPKMPGYEPADTFEDNVEEARRLLAEAMADAGIAKPEDFPSIEILYPTSDSGRIVTEALQSMWVANLGIEVKLYNQEWKVYLDSTNTQDYDVAWSAWIGDYVDPMTFLDMMVTDGGNNRTSWSNARYDRLVRDVQSVRDPVERAELFYEMERILGEECPIIPLYFYTSVKAVSTEVKGWHGTLLDIHPLHDIWLEREE